MAKRIANSTLNASTMDILNVIRANAGYDYQQTVPVVTKDTDIPIVGEVIYGTPALANQFLTALINRIALVRVKSATFNNPYSRLKKGYLEFGETIEEIFVNIATAVDFNPEKAEAREFKRTIPDVKSAFHVMNYRVMYPVTIQDDDLKQAFTSMSGVQDLIARIVDSIYTAAEYDEYLLFKYMLIKAVAKGQMLPKGIDATGDIKQSAVAFRGTSNLMTFIRKEMNEAGVNNNTPKERQVIFMDANYNAQYDVNVLASAFNMDKADFMGRLHLIDDWTTFDNDRFTVIRANSTGIEEVTEEELKLMDGVKAVLIDEEWFQVYDNNNKFTETYVSSGLYWNYFYHTWKTISHSPFANAVVFCDTTKIKAMPASLTAHIKSKEESKEATMLTIDVDGFTAIQRENITFLQTQELTKAGIGVQPYGVYIIPADKHATEITIKFEVGGAVYTGQTKITLSSSVDETVTCNKE